MKLYQNPSSGSRVVPCEQTDMTKLIIAFCNFANAPVYLGFWTASSSHVKCGVSNFMFYILTFCRFNTRIVLLVFIDLLKMTPRLRNV